MAVQATPTGIVTSRTADRNVAGQAVALTVFSTMRRWGLVVLPLFFWFVRDLRVPGRESLGTLRALSFIHFARWTIVRRIPYNGPPQRRERLRFPHLYFESNFNGGWEEYIDAFSYTLSLGMQVIWGSSYGFPGPVPAGPFKRYIRDNEIVASHFYSAYPDATATMILAALELEPRVDALAARAQALSPDEFATAWDELLTEAQGCL